MTSSPNYVTPVLVLILFALVPTVRSMTCEINEKTGDVRCSGWYMKFIRATVECTRVGDGLALDCAVKYGCKQGIIMGELRVCQKTPTLTYYADIYEMDVYDRRDDVADAVISLGLMGKLQVSIRGSGEVGVGLLEVTLGGNVIYKGKVRDSTCKNQVNGGTNSIS